MLFHVIIMEMERKKEKCMNSRYQEVNIVFLITTVVVVAAGFLPLGRMFPNYAMIFIVSQLIIFLPTFGYVIWSKQRFTQAIGMKRISLSNAVLLIAFAFCTQFVMNLINAISMIFAKNEISNVVMGAAEKNPFFITLLCVAIIPAILEESIYRGIFYHEYRKVNPLAGALLSGLLFGLLHGNLNQFSYAFCMGFIFSLVVEATDSILSTMIIHFIINGTSVVLVYLLPKIQELGQNYGYDLTTQSGVETVDFTLGAVLRTYGPSAVIFGIAGFVLFRTIAKNCGRWEHIKEIFRNKGNVSGWKLFTVPLIIAIVFWIVNMVGAEFMPI